MVLEPGHPVLELLCALTCPVHHGRRGALGEARVGKPGPGTLEVLLRLGQLPLDSGTVALPVPFRRGQPRLGAVGDHGQGVGHPIQHGLVVGDGHPHPRQPSRSPRPDP